MKRWVTKYITMELCQRWVTKYLLMKLAFQGSIFEFRMTEKEMERIFAW